MSDHTHIEWTDATWNPITGCSVVSAGCKHCYAMRLAGTRLRHHPSRAGLTRETSAGPVWNGQVRFNHEWLDQPRKWRAPRRIFVCAHGDLFHESVPDEWIDRVFAVMALNPQHTFQVLTKRAERMRAYFTDQWAGYRQRGHMQRMRPTAVLDVRYPLPNVWLGVSIEDQATANERIPELLATPAAVRFVSAEPLLGPVDLGWSLFEDRIDGGDGRQNALDWVICGGESGPGARPCDVAWIRSLVEQCHAAAVPCFVKQLGARPGVRNKVGGFDNWRVGHGDVYVGDHKGGNPAEWPEDLRVREFPRVAP